MNAGRVSFTVGQPFSPGDRAARRRASVLPLIVIVVASIAISRSVT